jgi:CRISPR-associated protein Csd1
MILQSLYQYYQRKAADRAASTSTEGELREGWEWKEIPFVIVLSDDGRFVAIEDTRERKRAKKFHVPMSVERSSNIIPYLLWDNLEYALGANPRNRNDVAKRHQAFRKRIEQEVLPLEIPSVKILLKFLDSDPIQQIEQSSYRDLWQEMLKANPFVTFRIEGFNHQSICDDLVGKWEPRVEDNATFGTCLVTGKRGPIARVHHSVKGVRGANANGAALVSFNERAFWSYGKTQSLNAPVCEEAAFAYTTALNILLGKDSLNKTTLGESTTIAFWADKKSTTDFDMEAEFGWFIADNRDDPDAGTQAVAKLYEAIKTGKLPADSDQRFFVLALAPNAGRIAVRFFRYGTTRQIAHHIWQHFEDLAIVRPPNYPQHPSLYRLMTAIAVQNKLDNVPPNLPAAVTQSILDGTLYPDSLLQACVRRIRATQQVSYYQAAILKAWLNRYHRMYHILQQEITMALDSTNTTPAYVLGRLFAVLERIQEAAQPGINATIRERFFGAAASSPAATFPLLLKLANHHLAKLDNPGQRHNLQKLLTEVMGLLDDIPHSLRLQQQALFALGYYHQRQDFFKSKNAAPEQLEAEQVQQSQ